MPLWRIIRLVLLQAEEVHVSIYIIIAIHSKEYCKADFKIARALTDPKFKGVWPYKDNVLSYDSSFYFVLTILGKENSAKLKLEPFDAKDSGGAGPSTNQLSPFLISVLL